MDADIAPLSSRDAHRSEPLHSIRDFRPELRSAIDQLSDAGFHREAFVLTASMEGAYCTATEMLGGIGEAVLRMERRLGPELPVGVGAAFSHALDEIRKVLPALV
jgi:hypothetical protein